MSDDSRPLGVDLNEPAADPYLVACPTCGASVDKHCTSRTGNFAPFHAARRRAGDALRKATRAGQYRPRDLAAAAIAEARRVAAVRSANNVTRLRPPPLSPQEQLETAQREVARLRARLVALGYDPDDD